MLIRSSALTFIIGFILGIAASRSKPYIFPPTKPPTSLKEIPEEGLSHNPEIKKRVLAKYMQLPHVTQVARSVLVKGQTASENWHRDMAELFLFTQGSGMIQLDDRNFSIAEGSVATVYPPTKHTIYNTGEGDLVVFSVASVP